MGTPLGSAMPSFGNLARGIDPANVIEFKPPTYTADEMPPDLYGIFALLVCLFALMLKIKIAAWIGLFLTFMSLTHMKSSEMDVKQIMCCVSFSGISMFTCYF